MPVANIECLFRPRSIGLFGADRAPGSIGRVLARNLFQSGFEGPIMPVHAVETSVHGVLAYPSPSALPIPAELAVIAVPPPEIPALIAELGARGTRAAVVVSHGFDAEGPAAAEGLRQRMLDAAKPGGVRIVGPGCLGVMVPAAGLNASWAHITPKDGDLAFVSRSGSLMTAMLDWAAARGVGFSVAASLGDMADVDFGDMLDHLALDADTRAVLLCVEQPAHPRKFLSAARAAARLKPVIVFDAARRAAIDESDSMHPSRAEVNDAAFRRAGLLPVASLADLVAAAATLGTGIRLDDDRIAILANGRGIADVVGNLVLEEGGRLAELEEATVTALDKALPATWGRRNPINLFADAGAERWRSAVGPLLADRGVDAVITVSAPTAIGDTLEAARAVTGRLERERKPVAAVWLEESTLDEARALFAKRRVPVHEGPGAAVEALMQLVRWRRNQDMLMETPVSAPERFTRDVGAARAIARRAIDSGREWLTEFEAKTLLAAYGIPVVAARDAETPEDAAQVAAELGFPVSIRTRVFSGASEVGAGVALELDSADAVTKAACRLQLRHARSNPEAPFPGLTVRKRPEACPHNEVAAGIAVDPAFGPVVLFGQGGDLARIVRDRAIGLPPLNLELAMRLIGETEVSRLLRGYGDRPPADVGEIAETLVKLSHIAGEIAEIVELEIDPLLVDCDGVVCLAARIRVAAATQPADARLAIRPYPTALEKIVTTRSGRELTMRPIRPEDEPALRAFVLRQSPEDRRLRFFSHIKELDHRMAARLTQIDYDREMALVLTDPGSAETEILGVMRISADAHRIRGEYAGAVRSDMKGEGLGRLLLEEIVEYGRSRGIGEIWGEVLAENAPMLGLVRKMGFAIRPDPDEPGVMTVTKPLA